jgi:hypothetical protein
MVLSIAVLITFAVLALKLFPGVLALLASIAIYLNLDTLADVIA